MDVISTLTLLPEKRLVTTLEYQGVGPAAPVQSVTLETAFGGSFEGSEGGSSAGELQRVTSETVSALQLVYELDNQIYLLSADDRAHIHLALGLTLTSGVKGDLVNVQRDGIVNDNSWNWVPGPIWLAAYGTLTQTPPETGFCLQIGSAVSPTRVVLNLQVPFDLE